MKNKKQGGKIKKANKAEKNPAKKANKKTAPEKSIKKMQRTLSSRPKKERVPSAGSHKKRKFEFTKMVASGNDFIIFDNRRAGLKSGPEIARVLCVRTNGVGADGLIFIESSRRADFKMRIFNPDGSEAEMCGNGIRCAVLYKGKKNTKVETLAGLLSAELKDAGIKVRMTDPKGLQLNLNLDIDGRIYQVNYVNTGVPHSVYFVENLEATNVRLLGRIIRYHRDFEPVGTNVDFAKIIDQDTLQIRTYERGVEEETLACGTGSVASALVYHHKFVGTNGTYMVNIHTKGNEVLKIYFDYKDGSFSNVWLEGKARMVYKGECYV